MKRIALFILLSFSTAIAFAQSPLKPVASIDLTKFSGKWYLISRLPNKLDKNLSNVSVDYTAKGMKLKEVFMGTKESGKEVKIKSTNTYKENGTFKGPLGKHYLVIMLGSNYEYFVMATEDRKNVWVMSRGKTIDNNTYNGILSDLVSRQIETTQLVAMQQK